MRVRYGSVRYATPTTLAEALELMVEPDMTAIAGGTDFYPGRVGNLQEGPVLDLGGLSELRGIEVSATQIRIGALTTWSEIAGKDLPDGCRALQQAAVTVGGWQIQNVGTIGGNLCNSSPAADGVPPLLVVDAAVDLASASGVRQMPLQDFLLDYRRTALRPDELLTAVTIPRHGAEGRSWFLKLGSRRYLVISVVMVGARLVAAGDGTITEARVAVGACSPVARRLVALERDLVGVDVEAASAVVDDRHLEMLTPIEDVRASAGYRRDAARVLVQRALDRCAVPA